jgi:hypothetical protein
MALSISLVVLPVSIQKLMNFLRCPLLTPGNPQRVQLYTADEITILYLHLLVTTLPTNHNLVLS